MKLSTNRNIKFIQDFSGMSQSAGNWVLSDTKRFNGTVPTGSFDISGCTKFMIEGSGIASGNVGLYFDSDNVSGNYLTQSQYSVGTYAGAQAGVSFFNVGWANIDNPSIVFDKNSKIGQASLPDTSGTAPTQQIRAFIYSGTAAMNTLNFDAGANTYTGTIKVYKWQDVKMSSLVTQELVKAYSLNAQTLNDTISVDGNIDEVYYIYAKLTMATGNNLQMRFNGDSGSNYIYSYLRAAGGAMAGTSANAPYMYFNLGNGANEVIHATVFAGSPGNNRGMLSQYSNSTPSGGQMYNMWTNTTNPITSLNISTTASCTGEVYVYKRSQAQVLRQGYDSFGTYAYTAASAVNLSFDVTDCDELMVSTYCTGGSSGLYAYFNNDQTAGNYVCGQLYNNSNSTAPTGFAATGPLIGGGAPMISKTHISNIAKYQSTHMCEYANTYTYNILECIRYTGAEPITTINLVSSSFAGKIKVHKLY